MPQKTEHRIWKIIELFYKSFLSFRHIRDTYEEKIARYTAETGLGTTSAVGVFPGGASPCGALDLAGNVWEWCHSLDVKYPNRAGDGREDPEAAGPRVLRGGSWSYVRHNARCACRLSNLPDDRSFDVGFRVILASALP